MKNLFVSTKTEGLYSNVYTTIMVKDEFWIMRQTTKRKIAREYISAKHNIHQFSKQVDTGFKAIRVLDYFKRKFPFFKIEDIPEEELK